MMSGNNSAMKTTPTEANPISKQSRPKGNVQPLISIHVWKNAHTVKVTELTKAVAANTTLKGNRKKNSCSSKGAVWIEKNIPKDIREKNKDKPT